ncbi:MAG: alpha/beta fold hydrolase [Propionibacteriaceae bacterium]|nr:alpha/beta fold hydrolase [Propionibacteriaceae bacterium]
MTRRTEVSFATSADGTRIAWSRHGSGPPIVRVAAWLSDLEQDLASPVWGHWLNDLGRRFSVIRYDERGSGLSDRDPNEYGLDAWVADLEAVVAAARLTDFALLGISQGGAVAVEYAVAHPERVKNLILWGAYARGPLAEGRDDRYSEEFELHRKMMKFGWDREDPVHRRVFTSLLIPGASESQMQWLDELQRTSTSPDAALASSRARWSMDVTSSARRVSTRTLVMHADGDCRIPFEEGRQLAALIPDATFVPVRSRNHILLADESAWPLVLDEVTVFAGGASNEPPQAALTTRELEVLRLVAQGCSNDTIGTQLSMSTRTVERHLSNIYVKLSLTGKSARSAAASRLPSLEHGPTAL